MDPEWSKKNLKIDGMWHTYVKKITIKEYKVQLLFPGYDKTTDCRAVAQQAHWMIQWRLRPRFEQAIKKGFSKFIHFSMYHPVQMRNVVHTDDECEIHQYASCRMKETVKCPKKWPAS